MRRYSKRELATLAATIGVGLVGLSRTGMTAQNEASEGHGTVVNGMAIYLGVLPSDVIAKGYGSHMPEYMMHGGPPRGIHFHHVMVALFDQSSGQRITDAVVTGTVRPIGLAGQTKKMGPFDVGGAMTYCNYFNMPQYGKYQIELEIIRPGNTSPTKAVLVYDHTPEN